MYAVILAMCDGKTSGSPGALSGLDAALSRLVFESESVSALVFPLRENGEPGPIQECSAGACRLLGRNPSRLLGSNILDYSDGIARQELARILCDLPTLRSCSCEVTLRDPRGRPTALLMDGQLFDDRGRCCALLLLRPLRQDRHGAPGPRAHEVPPSQDEAAAHLSRQASVFLELGPGDDIYHVIAYGLAELVQDASVLVSSCDPQQRSLTLRHLVGPIRGYLDVVRDLGISPSHLPLPDDDVYMQEILSGKLTLIRGGLYDLLFGAVPRQICATAERLLDIGEVHGIGIRSKGRLYGTIIILTRRGIRLESPELVEAFANLAGVALQRQQAMDDLASSKSTLLRFERLQAMGQLASGLAHDFNNLLTLVLGNSDLLSRSLPQADPLRRPVERILGAARKAASLTTQLLAFSRHDPGPVDLVAIDPIISDLEPILRSMAGERHRLVLRLDGGAKEPSVLIRPTQVEQIAMNLVSNACDAMDDAGELLLQTRLVNLSAPLPVTTGTLFPGEYLCLSVTDSGAGMPPHVEQQVFEPFFTTKTKEEGTGLGLSTVYGITSHAGGQIHIQTATGKGTTVAVYLPRSTFQADADLSGKAASPPSPPQETGQAGQGAGQGAGPSSALPEHRDASKGGGEANDKPAGRKRRMTPRSPAGWALLVEDQDMVRDLVRTMLGDLGYRTLAAAGGEEALTLEASHQEPIDLLVTDVVMPGLSGPELAERLLKRRPKTRVLFISGFTNCSTLPEEVASASTAFLGKPFTRDELERAIHNLERLD